MPRLPLKFQPNVDTLDRSSVLRFRGEFEIKEVTEIALKYKEREESRKLGSVSPFRRDLIGFKDSKEEPML